MPTPRGENGKDATAAASSPGVGTSARTLRVRAPWTRDQAVEGTASPLAHLSRAKRLARLMGLLEAAACAGDVSAAREVLSWERWRREMKEGRPPQRVEVEARGTIRVVDSLGVPFGRVPEVLQVEAEPRRALIEQKSTGLPTRATAGPAGDGGWIGQRAGRAGGGQGEDAGATEAREETTAGGPGRGSGPKPGPS